MPFSSGTFSLYSPGNPVVTGTTISSTWANNTLTDIATGLSTAVLKDGTQTITANIPMNSFKITGLAAGTTNGDAVRYQQSPAGILTAKGSLIGASAANTPVELAVGSNGQYLTAQSGQTAGLQWATLPNSLAQTFLGTNIALNNTGSYFNIVNTGSIGASGQTWLITGVLCVVDTAGAATVLVRIWDGTNVFAESEIYLAAANKPSTVTILARVTPSAATTYYLSAKDITSTSGFAQATGNAGTPMIATSITAQRIL